MKYDPELYGMLEEGKLPPSQNPIEWAILIIGAIVIAILLVLVFVGCAPKADVVTDATIGFQPLKGAKVADAIDIGDEAGGDISKDTTIHPQQGGGLQYTATNDIWAWIIGGALVVILLLGQEYFAYKKDVR